MNNKLEIIRKRAVMASFNYYPSVCMYKLRMSRQTLVRRVSFPAEIRTVYSRIQQEELPLQPAC
jgi:hypothetical protein